MALVNNVLTIDSFETGIEIDLKILQDKTNPKDRARVTAIELLEEGITITINGLEYFYVPGSEETSFLPVLVRDTVVALPDFVDGHYNIFNLDGDNEGLSFVAIPPQDFETHYLFRETFSTRFLSIDNNGVLLASGFPFFYNNGAMSSFGSKVSMQKFLTAKKDTSNRQYLFNAARDRNLYTEISLLWPSVKHNSMTVYDLDEDILIKGTVDYLMVSDKESGEIMHQAKMSRCVDFFGRKVEKEFTFTYRPMPILTDPYYDMNNASEYGKFHIKDMTTEDMSPMITDASFMQSQERGYMTASNNSYVFSLNNHRLKEESRAMRSGSSTFKMISTGDAILPMYMFESIDFDTSTIVVTNGTTREVLSIADRAKYIMTIGDSCLGGNESFVNFAGIEFGISPRAVTATGINITNFSDYAMLCRMNEEPTYGISGVRIGTRNLSYSLSMEFMDTTITCIYNIDKDKIYYINFDKKESVDSIDDFSILFNKYFTSVSELQLKKFLVNGTIAEYLPSKTPLPSLVESVGDEMYSEDVLIEKILDDGHMMDSIVCWSDGADEYDNMVLSPSTSKHYIARRDSNAALASRFSSVSTIYQQMATGIFASKPCSFKSVVVNGSSINFVFDFEGRDVEVGVDISGGAFEYKKGIKTSLTSDTEFFDHILGVTVNTNILYDKIYQNFGAIVLESAFDIGFVLNFTILERMIATESIGTYGTFLITTGNTAVLLEVPDTDTVTVTGEIIAAGTEEIDISSSTAVSAGILSSAENGNLVETVPSAAYAEMLTLWNDGSLETIGIQEIEELDNGSTFAIKFDCSLNQYLQIKE